MVAKRQMVKLSGNGLTHTKTQQWEQVLVSQGWKNHLKKKDNDQKNQEILNMEWDMCGLAR